MSFSHVASPSPSLWVWSMLEKEQERRKEGGNEGGGRAPCVRPSVVCEYDYISIDACIVQFGRGMATGVTSTMLDKIMHGHYASL